MLPRITITNNSIKQQSIIYKQLNDQTFPSLAIQFSISHLFALRLNIRQFVLFDPWIGPFQVLPLRARVDLGAMAMKGYTAFPKAPALLKPHHQFVSYQVMHTRWAGESYPSKEMQLVYFTSPVN